METEGIKKQKKVIHIKPYTTKEIAAMYGISTKTIIRWMEPIKNEVGEKRGRYFTVNQVERIFTEIGLPRVIEYN